MVLEEMLTRQDLEKIDEYVREIGYGCPMSSEKYLTDYVDYPNCKKDLFRLLGNQVIYKIPNYQIEKPEQEITKAIEKYICYSYDVGHLENTIANIFSVKFGISGFHAVLNTHSYKYISTSQKEEDKFTIKGKTLRLNFGLSYTKTISTIIKFLRGIQEEEAANTIKTLFEPVRNELSRITQDKILQGTFCLSIHPLDYYTMSDNGYGWRSCMSWDDGDFHAGTLEMLSSDYVVVAYLEGKEEWHPLGNKAFTWSNKKWRELFIVHEDFITSVKGYPYDSTPMRLTALNTLKELAAKNLGWEYGENEFQKGGLRNTALITGLMYNDYYDEHYFAVRPKADLPRAFNYSGTAHCLECGDAIQNGLENGTSCADCKGMIQCEDCGTWIYADDDYTYYVDGYYYCDSCYSSLPQCSCCGQMMRSEAIGGWVLEDIHETGFYDFCPNCSEKFMFKKVPVCELPEDVSPRFLNSYDKVLVPTRNYEDFIEMIPSTIII